MTHQVVPRLLPGAVEAGEGHAERGGAQGGVGGGREAPPVQRPVQVLGFQRKVRADRARGHQRGADQQRGVLGGNHGGVCSRRDRERGGKRLWGFGTELTRFELFECVSGLFVWFTLI